jgi:thermitase
MASMSRRVSVGLLSAVVCAGAAGVSTWALAGDEAPAASVRLIVGVRQGVDPSAAMAPFSAVRGVRVLSADSAGRDALAKIDAGTLEVPAARRAGVVAELRRDPDVAYVEVDAVRKAFDDGPDDPMYVSGQQPEMATIDAPAAWQTTTGAPVTVAVVDTGVTVPPVSANDLEGAVLPGHDFVNNDGNAADDEGHGTMVSSLVAGRGNNGVGMAGVCWGCRILPVKVLDKFGSGYDSVIAKGIIWATDQGAKIINMSLGGTESTSTLANAVAYANKKGVLVVVAAGNAGNTTKEYPAAYPDVLAVAATSRDFPDQRAVFSSYGSWVDVAAPGEDTVMDKDGAYQTGVQGTSFSAPLVSGIAGLVKTQHPGYTGWSLSYAITRTAHQLPEQFTQFGMVDAAAALNRATDTVAPAITGVSPGQNAKVHGKITVKPSGVGDAWSGVRNVDLYANGRYVTQSTTAPYALTFDTTKVKGTVPLEVRVYDKAGNRTVFARTVIADNVPPSVKITSAPKNGAKVKGTVKIAVQASDGYGVNRVELLVNGKVIQTDKAAPYAFSITASKQPKKMKVQVRAVDNAGNVKYDATRNWTR